MKENARTLYADKVLHDSTNEDNGVDTFANSFSKLLRGKCQIYAPCMSTMNNALFKYV